MLFSLEQYESFSHFWDKCWDVILFYAIPTLIIVCYNVLYKAMTVRSGCIRSGCISLGDYSSSVSTRKRFLCHIT
ncbi:hypothetical protein M8J77_002436 [Diaphorina citri]|nr:hypothetical protein M8J77_002436 [Diaphorina citri]